MILIVSKFQSATSIRAFFKKLESCGCKLAYFNIVVAAHRSSGCIVHSGGLLYLPIICLRCCLTRGLPCRRVLKWSGIEFAYFATFVWFWLALEIYLTNVVSRSYATALMYIF
jgi:hypothetical protein